jgi:hypothetical protein
MKKSNLLLLLVLACLAASDAPAQDSTPSQPLTYVDEAPLPKGWPMPGPYDQVSEKSYPSYRAAFTTEKRDNGAFWTLFSHIQKNNIPMTAPVEISMAEGDGQNLRQTTLAFLYQDTGVGKTGADGAKIEVRDVPAMKTLSYTWQGDRNEANIAKAKSALEAALKDRKIEAKGFRLLGYNGPGIPELKRTWELQALLRASALATPPVPTSATPSSTSTTLGSDAAPQAPTVDMEKQKFQPAAGEKFDPSEIHQALSDKNPLDPKEVIRLREMAKKEEAKEKADAFQILVRQSLYEPEERRALKVELQGPIDRALSELEALKKGGGSNQQIQEKIAALQAAIERGMKKDPKISLERLLGYRNKVVEYAPFESGLFVQSDPAFAIALLDQVPEKDRDFYREKIAYAWAESDPQAVLAWANKQTAPEFKELILSAVIPSMARTDLQGTLAYIQSLPPGYFQDQLIRLAFSNGGDGALARMHALPEGRTKDLAATGISLGMSKTDPQAAIDNASKIGDTGLRTEAEQNAALQWWRKDRTAAIQWMQSLPEGRTKDSAASGISQVIMQIKNDRKAAMDMASGIGDSNLRTEAQEKAVEYWFRNDPDAAIQWMQSLPEGWDKDIALNGILRGEYWLDPQACMDMALEIGDSNRRTLLLKHVAREWLGSAPAAATKWINSSALPQEVKTQLLQR